MDEDLKKGLAAILSELSKASSQGSKVIMAAEAWLKESSNMKEMELLDLNLSKLRQVAEEAEEVQSHWHP